jgi:hypothetical protein
LRCRNPICSIAMQYEENMVPGQQARAFSSEPETGSRQENASN